VPFDAQHALDQIDDIIIVVNNQNTHTLSLRHRVVALLQLPPL
jgi:hypothetical protein